MFIPNIFNEFWSTEIAALVVVVVYTCCSAYIHCRFKHAAMGRHTTAV